MKQGKELLSKRMTRKEFLQIAGLAILTLLGVSNFVSMLTRQTQTSPGTRGLEENRSGRGFGSSKFGA